MLIDYRNIDNDVYITINYRYIEWLDELLFREKNPFYNMNLKKYIYDTLDKCNISVLEGHIYHVPDNKLMLLGILEKQDKTVPHSFSWKMVDNFDCDKFYKENISYYENYYTQKNILFYFKLKNKIELAKFKLSYKEK